MDFALYRTIAAQAGVFTTAQARDTYSEWEIRRLISSGRWRRSRWRGVLLDAEVPDSPALDLRAAALAAGPDLVVCHSTAARLWGFDVLGDATLHFVGPPTWSTADCPVSRCTPPAWAATTQFVSTACGARRPLARRATACV